MGKGKAIWHLKWLCYWKLGHFCRVVGVIYWGPSFCAIDNAWKLKSAPRLKQCPALGGDGRRGLSGCMLRLQHAPPGTPWVCGMVFTLQQKVGFYIFDIVFHFETSWCESQIQQHPLPPGKQSWWECWQMDVPRDWGWTQVSAQVNFFCKPQASPAGCLLKLTYIAWQPWHPQVGGKVA